MPENDSAADDLEAFQKLYPLKPKDAIEAAAEFLGFMSGIPIDIGGGETWVLPNPSLLDDDQEDRYNEALNEIRKEDEQLDREPDPLTADGQPKLDDDGQPIKGAVITPAQIGGELVPNRNVRIAEALMGPDVYTKFKAAGGRASQITIHWQQMGKFMRERAARDSKSAGGSGVVDPVSDGTGI
jgi:hypothetical protein